MATFVLVHGAWSGGWCYARVVALLRARGHTVFTPTLTGQGERAHLFSGAINLSTTTFATRRVAACCDGMTRTTRGG